MKMKVRQKKSNNMRLYYVIPILFVIVCHLTSSLLALPITSQPLASNPEHLTWDAWQMPANSGPHPDHKAKKITPKSIFITPNFQSSSSISCPPDHKLDSHKRCIPIVKIDEHEAIKQKIEALLGQTTSQTNAPTNEEDGGDLYDYDYEEEEGDGPFQLNLPLTFEAVYPEEALPLKAGDETLLPFPAPHRPPHDDDSQSDAGTISFISVEKITNSTEESESAQASTGNATTTVEPTTTATDNTSDDANNDDDRQSSTTPGNHDSGSSTVSGDRSSTTDNPLSVGSDSTEAQGSTTDDDGVSSVDGLSESSTAITTLATDIDTSSEFSTEIPLLNATNDDNSSINATYEAMNQVKVNTSDIFDPFSEVVTGEMEWINYGNETDDISDDSFLENESFIVTDAKDTTTQKPDTTLDANEESSGGADIDYPLPSSQPDDETSKEMTESTPVFIVTPQSSAKPEEEKKSTTLAGIEDVEKILLGPANERFAETKDREHVIKHENNEAYLENLDSTNRFVYHHLTSSTTPKPSVVAVDHDNDHILNQIKEINRIVTENRLRHPNYPTKPKESSRIRFPTDYSSDVSFPAQNAQSFAVASGTRFAPPSYNHYENQYSVMHFGPTTTPPPPPTTSAASPTTKPPFWWLPPGWQVDQTGQKPTLLRFWERMPLVRDPSMMQRSSSRSQRRENSRSPSENLYQEISAQDIYKVLQNSNRDWKHTNS
ncbi:protein folded gastrulation [Culicoides brevitarsis]|uniref:protein folded gastrulation n=1 Tax=Culicoides brevitarsis TaxID=469753 RepID=UPI00307C8B63